MPCRLHQGCLAISVFRMHVRPGGQQGLDDVGVALDCRLHQGCLAKLVLRMHVRPGGHQGEDDGGVAMPCRLHQGCLAHPVLRIHVRPGSQQGFHRLGVALLSARINDGSEVQAAKPNDTPSTSIKAIFAILVASKRQNTLPSNASPKKASECLVRQRL